MYTATFMITSFFKIFFLKKNLYNPSSLVLVENDKIQQENTKKCTGRELTLLVDIYKVIDVLFVTDMRKKKNTRNNKHHAKEKSNTKT